MYVSVTKYVGIMFLCCTLTMLLFHKMQLQAQIVLYCMYALSTHACYVGVGLLKKFISPYFIFTYPHQSSAEGGLRVLKNA